MVEDAFSRLFSRALARRARMAWTPLGGTPKGDKGGPATTGTCDRSTIKRSKNVINRPLASTTLPVPRAVFLDAWTLDATATLTDFDLAASHGSCSTHARASSIEDRSRTRGVGVALRSRTATAPPMCVSLAARAPTPMRPTCCRAPCAACAHCSLLTAPRAWAGSPGKYGVRSK